MSQIAPHEITQILAALGEGQDRARERLLGLIYNELHRLAVGQMVAERDGHTLQPTALVHEAYLRLLGGTNVTWANRSHFFGAAAEAMRRILVDHARRRSAAKRNAATVTTDPVHQVPAVHESFDEILEVDAALNALESVEPEKAQVVKLRFFGGLTHEQIAESLGLSLRTVKRHWTYARAWLYRRITGE